MKTTVAAAWLLLITLFPGLCPEVGAEMEVVQIDPLGQHAHDSIPSMGYASLGQGTVALVHGDGSWPSPRSIYYEELRIDGSIVTEVVTSEVGTLWDPLLVVDSAGRPHVLLDSMAYDGGYRARVHEYVRDGDSWSPTLAFDSTDNNAMLVAAELGPDDVVHAVMCSRFEARLYHASNSGGAWQWQALPHEANARHVGAVSLAVDTVGAVHIAYDVENLASNPPQRVELRYVSNRTGAWHREVVLPQGNTSLSMHVGPSIALGPDSRPVIASTYGETAATGSLQYSQLRLNRRSDQGSWTTEVVADHSDGFAAGDGSQYTGWRPQLLLDPSGDASILFSDMACWHVAPAQYCQRGQIRLAVHDGGSWSLRTLYSQTVISQSYLDRMRIEGVVESPDGRFSLFALEGAPGNSGWVGSYSRLRFSISSSVLFMDGFESGDLSAWGGP